MKKILAIILVIFTLPSHTLAYTTADQQILLDFPVINTVETNTIATSAGINNETGALSNNLQINFDISTNHENGSVAEFTALVEAQSGSVNGLAGSFPFSNRGKLVLANLDALPDNQDIENALSFFPIQEKNNNVITYEIVFYTANAGYNNPVFQSINDDAAKGNIISTPGKTQVRVSINNNSLYLGSTFNKIYDHAGTYQATIYCTVYSP